MRIHVSHETTYRYGTAATGVIQTLRLTPRNHEGQHVLNWRIDVSDDARLIAFEDAFGNLSHHFTAEGPVTALGISVEGSVETQDTGGVIRGTVERFPPSLYLRETDLTRPDAAIEAYARGIGRRASGTLNVLHALLTALPGDIAFDTDPTHAATTAAEAFAIKRGVCQDITHVFIACARVLAIPARYIGGYFRRSDGVVSQAAGHAWAEAFVANLGWVGFDPTHGVCANADHVRVAVGLDYLGAAPVRGARYGGADENLTVAITVAQARAQAQT